MTPVFHLCPVPRGCLLSLETFSVYIFSELHIYFFFLFFKKKDFFINCV